MLQLRHMESRKTPMPGYGLAIIDSTQMNNIEFRGDDRFETPQTGILIKLTKQDYDKSFLDDGTKYGDLIGKRISWAKYSDADATFYDNSLNCDVVFIQLDKLRGYEEAEK